MKTIPKTNPRTFLTGSLVPGDVWWIEPTSLVDQELLEDLEDHLLGLYYLLPLVGIAIRPCLVPQWPKERPLLSCAPRSVLRLTRPESALAVVEDR